MEHKISQRSIGFDLFMKETARQESSTARIPEILGFQGHSGGITIDPELGKILIPYKWKESIFQGLFFQHPRHP